MPSQQLTGQSTSHPRHQERSPWDREGATAMRRDMLAKCVCLQHSSLVYLFRMLSFSRTVECPKVENAVEIEVLCTRIVGLRARNWV